MTRRQWLTGILMMVLAVILLNPVPGAGGAAGRKMTLMIYMCGSNLESQYGSATLDLQEMTAAGVSRDTAVLVMAGGSDTAGGAGYFQTGSTGIYEIGPGRMRSIWQSEAPLNMGDADTLTRLLQYGQENRPAEKYALILWDHGGGPLEGICWDETHDMDHLSLSELKEALIRAELPGKLSWIGFDACLMSSLEVAAEMAPYAEYMIASQETEPSTGWNYSFLKGLEQDADGAETGRRAVDSYFEGQDETGDILTLACTDLSAVQDVTDAMDPVFTSLERRLGAEQFVELSGLRMRATGFGKSNPAVTFAGYDLVDIRDLVSGLDSNEAVDTLLSALDRAVVYSRANEEGANGLTVYHPYANKSEYQAKWKETYQSLPFSVGYQQYIEAFGNILTGEALFRWLDLIPRALPQSGDGSYPFELPLTAEQAENVVSAQILILQDSNGNRLDRNSRLLASCSAEIGADHVARGSWDGRCLYAETEQGDRHGPISYLQTDDGKSNSIIGLYVREGETIQEGQMAVFDFDPGDQSEYPEIRRYRFWDEVTQSFSSRMAFSEKGFRTLLLYDYHRSMPEVMEDQVLPAYRTWETSGDILSAETITLPTQWRLHMDAAETNWQCYAVFQLLDSQQNAVCSLPVEVPLSNLVRVEPVAGVVENDQFRAELSCQTDLSPYVNQYNGQFGMGTFQMDWTLQNKGAEKRSLSIRNLTLNGTRIAGSYYIGSVREGETVHETFALGEYDLTGFDSLRSISGEFESGYGDERWVFPFVYEFEGCEVPSFASEHPFLAEGESEGIRIRVLEVAGDESFGWRISLLAENGSQAEFTLKGTAMEGCYEEYTADPVPAGMSRVIHVPFLNTGKTVYVNIPSAAESGSDSMAVLNSDVGILQSLDVESVQNVAFFFRIGEESKDERRLTIRFPEPLEVNADPWPEDQNPMFREIYPPRDQAVLPQAILPVLRETNLYRITLRRVFSAEDTIGLSLLLENKSDVVQRLYCGGCSVNGQPVKGYLEGQFVPAHSIRAGLLTLDMKTLEAGSDTESEAGTGPAAEADAGAEMEIRSLGIALYEDNLEAADEAEPCLLTVDEPFRPGQLVWLRGDQLFGETVRPEDLDLESEMNPKALAETLSVPENAASFRREYEFELSGEAARYRVCLVQETEDGKLLLITMQDGAVDAPDGKITFVHPGLFPCVEGNEKDPVLTYLRVQDEAEIQAESVLGAKIWTYSMDSADLDEIKWILDRETGEARVVSFTQDSAPYTRQSEISTASYPTCIMVPKVAEDGRWLHMNEMEKEFSGFFNTPSASLKRKPLRLKLREIREEDHLCLLISIRNQDGSGYSLPLINLE